MPRQQFARHTHRFRTQFATGLLALSALTASVAPSAWADPQPLARAEAAVAANYNAASRPVRPNPDEQTASGANTYGGTCSEVCSSGGYGSTSQASRTPDRSGAALPHDPRPRSSVLSETQVTSLSKIQRGAEEAGLHPGVYGPSEAAKAPTTIVQLTAPHDGFDWGDASIGAAGMLGLTLIGAGGLVAVTNRRNHRTRDQHAT